MENNENQSTQSQSKKILAHLKAGKTITPLQALNLFGCMRLSARIYDLNEKGHNIKSEMISIGKKRFARYYLKYQGE